MSGLGETFSGVPYMYADMMADDETELLCLGKFSYTR